MRPGVHLAAPSIKGWDLIARGGRSTALLLINAGEPPADFGQTRQCICSGADLLAAAERPSDHVRISFATRSGLAAARHGVELKPMAD